MEKKVLETIQKNNLIDKGDTVIAAVSGGADSMALLDVLITHRVSLGIDIAVAHVNHGLRPEAEAEAQFVADYCDIHGIPFHLECADVASLSAKEGIGEELCGRRVRYSFFSNLLKQYPSSKLATAHHKNDNAETVLMHIIRGAGLRGVCGIDYKRDNIIRPLLDVSRAEIEGYCSEKNISYCTDMSNFSADYTRNKLRLKTIPHIECEYNKSFCDALTRLSASVSEDFSFIEAYAYKKYSELADNKSVDIKSLLSEHKAISKRIIRHMIADALGRNDDISHVYVEDVYNLANSGKTGKEVILCENVFAQIVYGRLKIDKKSTDTDFSYRISEGETVYVKEADIYISMVREDGLGFVLSDYDNVYITNRRRGDVFFPEGFSGSKKLKEFMIDSKIPKDERNRTPIIRYNEEILSVSDIRRDRRCLGTGGVIFKFERGI